MHILSSPAAEQSTFGDDTSEPQVGGGPSKYGLCSNISLTPKASKEAQVAATKHQHDYPAPSSDLLSDDIKDLDNETLLSLCTDSYVQLTPSSESSPTPSSLPRIQTLDGVTPAPHLTPPSLLTSPLSDVDPFIESPSPATKQRLADDVKEAVFDILASNEKLDDVLGISDERSQQQARAEETSAVMPELRGRLTGVQRTNIDEAYHRIMAIFDETATKTGWPVKSLIKEWAQLHGHTARKSLWNIYQGYFVANAKKECESMKNPTATGAS